MTGQPTSTATEDASLPQRSTRPVALGPARSGGRAGPGWDLPSRSDRLVARLSERLGGPIGDRAQVGTGWWSPLRVVLAVGVLSYLAGMVLRWPCRQGHDAFVFLCYSDVGILYRDRGLIRGLVPYLDSGDYPVLEYPVLTGWLVDVERRLTALLGGAQGVGLSASQEAWSAALFAAVNAVLLAALLLVALWATVRATPTRPWDAMMVAASPCLAAAALINWDLLPVALTALGLMFWSRSRPGWAGVLLGLGMAAKLYPLFLLGPLVLLCLRAGKLRAVGVTAAAFAASWLAVNLPVVVLAPDAWLDFWRFNRERVGDFGSIWYVFALAGHPVPRLNAVSSGLFALACLGIAALVALAPRRPRLGSVAFLVVLAFLMTNKVYSPQYVLWLLPLLALARPRWRDWMIFTAGELIYYVAIWWHLAGRLAPGDGSADQAYWLAVAIRLGCEAWVAAIVIRGILRPAADPVRSGEADDPLGGVLDGARDVPWWPSLRLASAPQPAARSAAAPGAHAGSGRVVVQAWLASRGLLALVALLMAVIGGRSVSDMVSNWDVQHFAHLALGGYDAEPDGLLRAFFPGLPLLLGLFATVGVPVAVSGVLLSVAFSAVAAAALYRLGGTWPAVLWLFAPTAVFTVVPYTESLFCAAAFWAWERARRDHWLAAAVLAAAACTVRVSGLFLLGALVVMILTGGFGWRGALRRLAFLLIPASVLAAFVIYLHAISGSWTAWFQAQSTGWVRGFTWPWQSFLNTIPAILPGAYADHPWWAAVFRGEMVSMAAGVLTVCWCLVISWRRRHAAGDPDPSRRPLWAEASWVGVQVLAFSLSYWFFSVNRATLLWFPMWIMLAGWAARARRPVARAVVGVLFGVEVALMLWWAWLFYSGHWAS